MLDDDREYFSFGKSMSNFYVDIVWNFVGLEGWEFRLVRVLGF